MKPRFKNIFLGIIAVLLLGCVSCQIQVASKTHPQIEEYEVRAIDLPTGWKFTGQSWNQIYGGQSHLVAYGIDNNTIIRLTHTISIYPDEEQAKTAYPKWEEEQFKGSRQEWSGADFLPSDPTDDYKFECVQLSSDKSSISCRYLQRHKQLISFVLVNLDGKAMTFAQLNAILKAVDDRLNQIELKQR